MPANEPPTNDFDWRVTSFDGARREQLRRWALLPLENILMAIEEMQDISQWLGSTPTTAPTGAGMKGPHLDRGGGPDVE